MNFKYWFLHLLNIDDALKQKECDWPHLYFRLHGYISDPTTPYQVKGLILEYPVLKEMRHFI